MFFDRPSDFLCFGLVPSQCLMSFSPMGRGVKSLRGIHPLATSSYPTLGKEETPRGGNLHMCLLIMSSCLFTGIRTLCILVCVEHSSENIVATTAVGLLEDSVFTRDSADFVSFTRIARPCCKLSQQDASYKLN